MMRQRRFVVRIALALALLGLLPVAPAQARAKERWVAAWASAQLVPASDAAVPAADLSDATVRQVIRVSLAGSQVRLRLSNVHGTAPLRIGAASLARSAANATARLVAGSLRPVTFGGLPGAVIPAGAELWSDPVDLAVARGEDLAVSLYLPAPPTPLTSHPGSRASSHFIAGNRVSADDLPGAKVHPRWVLVAGAEVVSRRGRAVVAFGDSITDGYGVQPDTNLRWTDHFARRLAARRQTRDLAVLNAGIGGNRLVRDGLGPNALARFERDVLSHPGVTHVIVFEGVNDLGVLTRDAPATPEAHAALVREMIEALRQMVLRARSRGVKAIGATILPYGGSAYYHPDAVSEVDRQAVNAWIRTPGNFDAVIDFDAALRDPANPTRLRPELDSGDGLHPSLKGYEAMAAAVPLDLFAR